MPARSSPFLGISVGVRSYLRGIWNASNVVAILPPLARKRGVILTTALKASAVNLLIIVGSELGVLDRGVLPAIRAFGAWAYLPEGAIASAITSAAASVGLDYDPLPMPQSSSSSSPSSYSTHSSSSSATYPPPEWVPQLCAYIFYVLWLFPIWLLVYLAVNIGTYSEVATLAHEQRHGPGSARGRSAGDLKTFAGETYRYLFYFFLLSQTYTLAALPNMSWLVPPATDAQQQEQEQQQQHDGSGGLAWLRDALRTCLRACLRFDVCGRVLALLLTTLLCSLCAFEYAWTLNGSGSSAAAAAAVFGSSSVASPPSGAGGHGMPVARRHACIEEAWPYFAGFGTPLAVATFFAFDRRPFASLGLYAMLFPLNILLAMRAAEASSSSSPSPAEAEAERCSAHVPKLPVFAPSYALMGGVVGYAERWIQGEHKKLRQKESEDAAGAGGCSSSSSSSSSSLTPVVTVPEPPAPTSQTSGASAFSKSAPPAHLQSDLHRAQQERQRHQEREERRQQAEAERQRKGRGQRRSLLLPRK